MSNHDITNADPGLRQWWPSAEQNWKANKTRQSTLSLMDNLNYQNKLSKQLSAVKHKVVYTASGNTLAAVRITTPRTIIEHALYWLPASGETEARYLTAVLNTPVTTRLVSAYQSEDCSEGGILTRTSDGY